MKKLYALVTVAALSLTLGITAIAQGRTAGKGAKKAGCSSCNQSCTPEQMKKFKADSIDLRQEMMNKRFDLQREELKAAPDTARVAAIKADIETIKVKIDALKTAAKIPVSASCCKIDCPLMDGNCDSCKNAKGCQCKDCKCKDCRDGKACSSCKDCKGCACGKECKCGPDCTCPSCKKAKKGAKKSAAGCANCNKKGSM